MASYPSQKKHQVSRRKLGRGQHVQVASVTPTIATITPTITLTFPQPVIAGGPLTITAGSLAIVSQQQLSATTYEFIMSGTTTTAAYNFPGNQPNIKTAMGGAINGVSGTF